MFKNKIITSIVCLTLITSILTGCQNQKKEIDNETNTEKVESNVENGENKLENEDKNNENSSKKMVENEDNSKSNDSVEIIYYTYDINTEDLKENKKKVDKLSVKNIVDELIEKGVLQKGTDVNKSKVEYIDDVKTLTIDMNAKFINFDLGSSSETLMLQAFTNSLIKSFNVNQLKLTVDGENYSSGHIVINDGQFLKFK